MEFDTEKLRRQLAIEERRMEQMLLRHDVINEKDLPYSPRAQYARMKRRHDWLAGVLSRVPPGKTRVK